MTLPEPAPRPPDGYLDAVGGQPLLPVAREAWLAAVESGWSDPARLHHEGRRAGALLDAARASIATSLGVRPDEVFLTTSGPTAVGVAVTGLLQARAVGERRVVASAVESLAVLSPAGSAADRLDLVPVDGNGLVSVGGFAQALAEPAALACLQAANPEVGTVQPVAQVAAATRAAGVPLLVHAVQVIGRMPVPPDWDVLCAAARDWGGPAGVGVLAVRAHVRWRPDENPDRGWVSGFPDIPGAVAAARALEYLRDAQAAEALRHRAMTERLRDRLPHLAEGIVVTGDPADRLPHVVTFTCDGVVGEAVVDRLARAGYSVASGSACTSDVRMPSQVLAAMGVRADASVRVSLPLGCADDIVEEFLAAFPDAVAAARS
jgi:cysteine desulfurase